MDAVRKNVEHVLCDSVISVSVVQRLIELGVTGISDLVEITIDDLTPSVLLPVPARKLVRYWNTPVDENSAVSPSSPVRASQPSTPSVTFAATPSAVMTTPVSNSDSKWASKFCIQDCVREMIRKGNVTQRAVACRLNEGKCLMHSERNELIRYITELILRLCGSPCRQNLSIIADTIVAAYPQLKDEVGGTVIGPGYLSVRNQLESRMTYVKRPMNNQRREASARRRLDNDENTDMEVPKKRMRDGYGCLDFLPIELPEGDGEDSLKMKHLELQATHSANSWNSTEISELMQKTYVLQRRDLVGCRPLSVRDVCHEWPFLCEPRWMIEHLNRLLGINIMEKLESNLMAKKDTLFQYLKSVARTMKNVQSRLADVDVATQPTIGILSLLMSYFGESETVLFRGYEVRVPSLAIIACSAELQNACFYIGI